MKKARFIALLLVIVFTLSAGFASADSRNFRAHLAGRNEVPADTGSQGQGQAIFQFSTDGAELSFKLIIANIENVTMAHIHLAPEGVNGPIVLWLRPSAPPPQLIPGRFDGVFVEGTATAANLVGPLAGMTLDDLRAAMEAGDTYVNVHTSQFGGGEIRGQIH